jgi:DNA-binding CsgD family transcriptional regulator
VTRLDLSPPELLALAYAAQGYTVDETAALVLKSPQTIKSQLMWSRLRLGARNTTHAVVIALRTGLLDSLDELAAAA